MVHLHARLRPAAAALGLALASEAEAAVAVVEVACSLAYSLASLGQQETLSLPVGATEAAWVEAVVGQVAQQQRPSMRRRVVGAAEAAAGVAVVGEGRMRAVRRLQCTHRLQLTVALAGAGAEGGGRAGVVVA